MSHYLRYLYLVFLLAALPLAAADLHVGSGQTYTTIQAAVDAAGPGDRVLIHSGTYREAVVLGQDGSSGNPIVIEPAGDAEVVVSGAELVTGWELFSGNIYRSTAPVSGMSDRFENQIFVDGVMMNEARWPNSPLDPLRPEISRIESAQYWGAEFDRSVTFLGETFNYYRFELNDPRLSELDGLDLSGAYATINPGLQNLWRTAEVFDKDEANHRIRVVMQDWTGGGSTWDHHPREHNPYYLFGALSLLDYPGEWVIGLDNHLYLMTPDGDTPENHVVEMKQRTWLFDLTERDYVTIRGLKLFAGGITTEREATIVDPYDGEVTRSSNILIDGIHARYVYHNVGADEPGFTTTYWHYANNSGIAVNGDNSEIRNSVIEFSSANGITLLGYQCKAINNVVTNCNYVGLDNAPISTGFQNSRSEQSEIAHNTILNSGRALILARNIKAGQINYNYLANSCMTTSDYGALYTWGHDGFNTEIAYNWVTDNTSEHFGSIGIYIDDGATNFNVHHNVSWNTKTAFVMNMVNAPSGVRSDYHNVYNNTFEGIVYALGSYDLTNVAALGDGWNNTQIYDNNFIGASGYRAASNWNNYEDASKADFVDFNGLDFRPVGGSQANGKGAYPSGSDNWRPGAGEEGQPAPVYQPIQGAPTHLTYTVLDDDRIQLNWQDNASGETGYVIDRSENGEGFYTVATTGSDATSAVIEGRAITNSFYRVRADTSQYANYIYVHPDAYFGNFQLTSGRSRLLLGDKISGAITIPSFESGSPVDNIQDGDVMRLNDWYLTGEMDNLKVSVIGWGGSFPSPGGTIEVRLDSQNGPLLTSVSVPDGNGLPSNGKVDTPVSITGAEEGLHDLYLVFRNSTHSGHKLFLMGDFIFTAPTEFVEPAKPALAVTDATAGSVSLQWSAATGATHYVVERSDDLEHFYQLALLESASTTYTDNVAAVSSNRYYRVRARNLYGDSPYDYAAANVQGVILAKPTDLVASTAGATSIDLSWTDASDNEDEFIIEQSLDGVSGWVELAGRPVAGSVAHTVIGLTEGTRYFFRLRASNSEGVSQPSNVADAWAGGQPVVSLYAYEGFDGSTESGTGWDATGWVHAEWSGFTVEAGQSFGSLPVVGGSARTAYVAAERGLETAVDFTGGEVWISWLHTMHTTDGASILTTNRGLSGSPAVAVQISSDGASGLTYTYTGGTPSLWGTGSANAGTTYCFVLRLAESGGTTTATLWRYEGGTIPASYDEGSSVHEMTLSSGDASLHNIGFDAYSTPDFQLDEIRIGASYEAVTGQATASSGYDDWAQAELPEATYAGVRGRTDDADGDGLSNLVEYALGSSPTDGSQANRPMLVLDSGSLYFEFQLGRDSSDLNYMVEFSDDFSDWSTITAVPVTGSAGETVRVPFSLGSAKARFARLCVGE